MAHTWTAATDRTPKNCGHSNCWNFVISRISKIFPKFWKIAEILESSKILEWANSNVHFAQCGNQRQDLVTTPGHPSMRATTTPQSKNKIPFQNFGNAQKFWKSTFRNSKILESHRKKVERYRVRTVTVQYFAPHRIGP